MIGQVCIGGGEPITVQSMTNTDTRDICATVAQVKELTEAGCDIVRIAVPDMESAAAFGEVKKKTGVPLVADIHFDYRLAMEAIKNGADKIRINPGNIGGRERVRRVIEKAKERRIPVRIGVNAGSLSRNILEKYGFPTPEAMVECAMEYIKMVEGMGFEDIVVSLKTSSVPLTVRAYQMISGMCRYPLHLGITEAGLPPAGIVKSAVGIGSLLVSGIGDTIRVSLTGDPVEEVRAGIGILKALEIRRKGLNLVSCPTCGRCRIDIARIAREIEERLKHIEDDIKVAVMGCAVNGPGEARDADVGVAGGDGCGVIFRKGKIVRKVPEEEIIAELVKEIEMLDM